MASYVSYFEGLTARALSIAPYQMRVSNATRLPGLYSQDITLLVFPASAPSSAAEFDVLFTQFASWNVSAGQEWSLSIAGPYGFLDFFQATAGTTNYGLATGTLVGIVIAAVAASSALAALLTLGLLRSRNSKYSRDILHGTYE